MTPQEAELRKLIRATGHHFRSRRPRGGNFTIEVERLLLVELGPDDRVTISWVADAAVHSVLDLHDPGLMVRIMQEAREALSHKPEDERPPQIDYQVRGTGMAKASLLFRALKNQVRHDLLPRERDCRPGGCFEGTAKFEVLAGLGLELLTVRAIAWWEGAPLARKLMVRLSLRHGKRVTVNYDLYDMSTHPPVVLSQFETGCELTCFNLDRFYSYTRPLLARVDELERLEPVSFYSPPGSES
jgi:hypothetical protein